MSSVQELLGPIVAGTLVNTLLFGICAVQAVTYFTYSGDRRDPRWIRCLVVWALFIDLYQTTAAGYLLWKFAVDNFGNVHSLTEALWPFAGTPIATVLVSCPIQGFLAYRIKLLSKSTPIFITLISLSVAQATAGLTAGVGAILQPNINTWNNLIPAVDIWMGTAVACDLGITFFLLYYMLQARSLSRRTQHVINRMIRTAVETAAFASVFCALELFCFTRLQRTNFHLLFSLPMGRIYTNTLLTTLNDRFAFRLVLQGIAAEPTALGVNWEHVSVSASKTASHPQFVVPNASTETIPPLPARREVEMEPRRSGVEVV